MNIYHRQGSPVKNENVALQQQQQPEGSNVSIVVISNSEDEPTNNHISIEVKQDDAKVGGENIMAVQDKTLVSEDAIEVAAHEDAILVAESEADRPTSSTDGESESTASLGNRLINMSGIVYNKNSLQCV